MSEQNYPGVLLTGKAELLRRVAPGGKSKGASNTTPGSEAFKPAPAPSTAAFKPGGKGSHDNGGLSTKREVEDPKDAYWAYLRSATPPGGRTAIGTWGFTVGEADSIGLPSYDDGGTEEAHPKNHATVWFPIPPTLSNRELKLLFDRLAEDLLNFALGHKCLFRPDDPEEDARSLREPRSETDRPTDGCTT